MKKFPRIASCSLLAAVIFLRLLFPDAGKKLRESSSAMIKSEEAAVFTEKSETAEVLVFCAAEVSSAELMNPAPTGELAKVIQSTADASEFAAPQQPEETPLPEAVAAFLEAQAAFPGYEIPQNADADYEILPFEYAQPVDGCVSSGFGYRVHPIYSSVRFHYGTDVAACTGEPVCAFADGTVLSAGWDESCGWNVLLDHGDGWQTRYVHCSALYVTSEQIVSRGECIAAVGATGLATGPHLHFEILRDGQYRNPEYYLNG